MTKIKTILPAVKKLHRLARAINHPLRVRMLELLLANPGTYVQEMQAYFNLEQSVTSQHLAILREAGVVKIDRNGRHIAYSVDTERMARIEAIAGELTN